MKDSLAKKTVLSINSLVVRRSPTFALRVDGLHFSEGSTVCLAGANGSGKTTLIEVVAGLLTPQEGKVTINGHVQDGKSLPPKHNLGYIPDDDGWIIAELTAGEYFTLLLSIRSLQKEGYGKKLVNDLAGRLLFDSFSQQLGSLSHGNRKKVQIIAGVLHSPKVLLVDELRNGLDPIAIKVAEDLLKDLAKQGTAIVTATHDLWWAERFAEEVVMINKGEVVLQAPTKRIVAEAGSLEAKFMKLYANHE